MPMKVVLIIKVWISPYHWLRLIGCGSIDGILGKTYGGGMSSLERESEGVIDDESCDCE